MIDNTIALDVAASALVSLARGWNVASPFLIYSAGDVGVDGLLFVGVDDDEDLFRRWCMVDAEIQRVSVLFFCKESPPENDAQVRSCRSLDRRPHSLIQWEEKSPRVP